MIDVAADVKALSSSQGPGLTGQVPVIRLFFKMSDLNKERSG